MVNQLLSPHELHPETLKPPSAGGNPTSGDDEHGNTLSHDDMSDSEESIDTTVLLDSVGELVERQVMESALLRANLDDSQQSRYKLLPRYDATQDLTIGRVLGRGGSCIVYEVDNLGGETVTDDLPTTDGSKFSLLRRLRGKSRSKSRQDNRDHGNKQASQQGSLRLDSEWEDVDGSSATDHGAIDCDVRIHNDGRHTIKHAIDVSLSKGFLIQSQIKDCPSRGVTYSDSRHHHQMKGTDNGRSNSQVEYNIKNADEMIQHDSGSWTQSEVSIMPNTGSTRFVFKRVAPEYLEKDKPTFFKGTVDLAMEAHYLSALHHPNIVALIGMSASEPSVDPNYFILIERLEETLTKRSEKWAAMNRINKGITGAFIRSKKRVQKLLHQQMEAAYDIAAGCEYLHEQNIIFRSLKPDNIGFDSTNVLKLFDFGLSREIQEEDKVSDGLYRMTGMTGTLRYMAPEVALDQPYNLSADVYSWSMLMWSILALEAPFAFFTQVMLYDRVVHRGSRPTIFKSWPQALAATMRRAWDADIENRPSFTEIKLVIKEQLYSIERDLM